MDVDGVAVVSSMKEPRQLNLVAKGHSEHEGLMVMSTEQNAVYLGMLRGPMCDQQLGSGTRWVCQNHLPIESACDT